jgi:hypothetical protein
MGRVSTYLAKHSRAQPDGSTRASSARASEAVPAAWVGGAIAAVQAAAGSLVIVLVPVVATWVVTAGGTTSWLSVVRLAFSFWLLAQHAALLVDGGQVGIVPLGLAVVPAVSCWFAGRRLGRTLDPRAEKIAAGATRSRPSAPPRTALATMALTYGGLGAGIGLLARMDGVAPVLWQSAVGPAVVALVFGTLGAAAYRFGGAEERFGGAVAGLTGLADRLPAVVYRWLVPAVAAVGVVAAAAAVTVAVLLVLGASRVMALEHALGGGVLGGVVIALAQLALLPNLVVWAGSALAGPGFSVGAGTSVTPVASTLGPLPAVPALAALPAPGELPTPVLLVLAVPVLAGVVGAQLYLRRWPDEGRLALLRDVAGFCVSAGLLVLALAWLSGGAAGPGRLSATGPDPVLTASVFAAEVFAGAVLTVLVRRGAPALVDVLSRR